jgi:hypothetical protein
MDLSKFKTDGKLSQEGVVIDLGDNSTVTVARAGNEKFNKSLRAVAKKFGHSFKSLGDEKLERVVMECYVGTVLLNWSGFKKDGQDLPFSKESAVELMLDKEYVDLRTLIENLANEPETFRREQIEAVVGE